MKKLVSILVAIIIIASQMSVFALDTDSTLVFTTYENLPITANRPHGFVSLRSSTVSTVDRGNGDLAIKVTGAYELDLVQNTEEKYGVWEFGFDFRTSNAKTTKLGFRMTSDTSNGYGVAIGSYKSELYVASPSDDGKDYGGKVNGKIGNISYKVGTTEADWNTYKIRIDYVNNTFVEYLNGVEACSGTIGNTFDYFKRIRLFGSFGENDGYFDNIILKEVSELSVSDIKYQMSGGTEVVAVNDTINGVNLDKLTFTLNADANVTAENAKVLNENGDIVSGTVTASGSDVVFGGFSTDILPNGNYKLVLESSAIVGDEAIGSLFEKPFVVDNKEIILSPAAGSVLGNKVVELSAYVADADKVWFEINDEKVCEFENIESSVYKYVATLSGNGVYYFDVYAEKNGSIVNVSRTFTVDEGGMANLQTGGNLNNKGDSTNVTLSSKLTQAGRAVIEGDLTINTANTGFWFEIGANTSGVYSTSSAYVTLFDAPGMDKIANLLTEDGKIYTTNETYAVGEEMHIKFVIDMDSKAYEFYKDGKKIFTKEATGELKTAKILYHKLRLRTSNSGTYSFKNINVYQETENPKVIDVLSGGVSVKNGSGNFVLPSSATEISVVFDKAYQTVSANDVMVKCGENVITPTAVTNNAETKTLTIEGLTLDKNKTIEVMVSENATVNVMSSVSDGVLADAAKPTGKSLNLSIYVGDEQSLVIMPLVLKKDGNNALAYAKYVNAGSEKSAFFFIADYASETRLSSANVKDVTFVSGKGIVADNKTVNGLCSAMLWNKDFSPLADMVSEE